MMHLYVMFLIFLICELQQQTSHGQSKHVVTNHAHENKGPGVTSWALNSTSAIKQKWQTINNMIASTSPKQHKQVLGEKLYPLVEKHQVKKFIYNHLTYFKVKK